MLITHSPSSLTRMHWLASSNSKSWSNSTRLEYSGSDFSLRLPLCANHSGRERDEEPERVYTGTDELLESFMITIGMVTMVQSRTCKARQGGQEKGRELLNAS